MTPVGRRDGWLFQALLVFAVAATVAAVTANLLTR